MAKSNFANGQSGGMRLEEADRPGQGVSTKQAKFLYSSSPRLTRAVFGPQLEERVEAPVGRLATLSSSPGLPKGVAVVVRGNAGPRSFLADASA